MWAINSLHILMKSTDQTTLCRNWVKKISVPVFKFQPKVCLKSYWGKQIKTKKYVKIGT
jgi:hypothetical protein